MSSTHFEPTGNGHSVRIQHCERKGCDKYLGVNYPASYCTGHEPTIADLDADWKIIRRAVDELANVIDNVVNDLIEEFDLPDDEDSMNALTDRVYALVTTGKIE